ncbi:putative adenylate kinase 1 chloroplastic [Bienertia sinuspersici]
MAVISRLIRSTTSNSSLISTSINILSRNFTSLTSETTLHSRHSWNDSSNNKPLTLRTEPKGRNVHWVFLGCPGVGKGTYATRLSKLLNVPHIATGDLVRDELASAGPLSPQIAEIVNKGKLVSDEIIIDLLSKRLEAGEAKAESGFILDGFPRTVRQASTGQIQVEMDGVSLSNARQAQRLTTCGSSTKDPKVKLLFSQEEAWYWINKRGTRSWAYPRPRGRGKKAACLGTAILIQRSKVQEGELERQDQDRQRIALTPGSIQRLLQELREEALLAKCLGRRICSECGGNYNIACIDIKGENGSPGLYMAPLLPPTECAEKLITRSDDNEEVVRERLRIYDEMTRPVEEFYSKRGKLLKFDLPGGIPESWPKLLQALNLDDHEDGQSAAA